MNAAFKVNLLLVVLVVLNVAVFAAKHVLNGHLEPLLKVLS